MFNKNLFIRLFFQMFYSEIKELPSAVVGKVSLLPDLLCESRTANTAYLPCRFLEMEEVGCE